MKITIDVPCLPGDDLYWIDERDGSIQCQKGGVAAVCYYGNGVFKIIAKEENQPEEIGGQYAQLTREGAEEWRAANNG